MTTSPTHGKHAQPLRPKFGDLLRNTMASERNPRRDAYFIREVRRSSGGVNPGRWFEMTDGKGETWLSNPQNMVPVATSQVAALTASPVAQARVLEAVIKAAAEKLDAAVCCHPDAVDALIHEALEILDGDREPEQPAVAAPLTPELPEAELPDWLPYSKRLAIAERHGQKVTAEFNALVRDVIHSFLDTHALRTQQPAPAAAGLPVTQEPKYTVDGAHIVNRASGEAVPHDEPVFVFRARDALGVRALEAYLNLIGEREPSSAHADAVRGRIADFQRFAANHPERMKWPDTSPTPQADSQPDLDMAVMQLAESVGLIGPASRVGDLHAAIQRFHDLICVDATIKAAVMAADVIRGAATSVRDYPPLPMQFACSGVFPVYSADHMRAYVDADRAARAPADSVTAPAGGVADGWKWAPEEPTLDMGWAYLDAARESEPLRTHTFNHAGYRAMLAVAPTPPAQAADSVLEDAERLDFLCSTDKVRMIECEQKGLWRVYQDEAPPEAAQHHWQAIASEWHTTPRAAIDAARKQGGAT